MSILPSNINKAEQLLQTPLEVINKELAERHLSEFIKQLWGGIDPHEYIHGWHIDAISEHLEAVLNGEIRRLLINIPPRHMKSIGFSVGFPAWAWIKRPELQFLFSSYASVLSIRDGVKCRRVIDNPIYQRRWADKFSLTSDQNTKIRFDNDKGGYRIATSVDGMTTGEGGDIIGIDDANNVKEAESDITRTATNQWFDEVMQSRFNNPKTGALVAIQQRTHANDLSGHIMKKYGNEYCYLILPGEYEIDSKRKNNLRVFHGWSGDPRKEEGELLWPQRFGRDELERLKLALGSYAAAGQIQQRPAPREGGVIPLDKFRRYSVLPSKEEFIRFSLVCDTAKKDEEIHDYSCLELWGETSRGLYLIYVWRKKVQFPELKRRAILYCTEFHPHEVLIEDKSSGTSLAQCLKEETKFPIILDDPGSFSKVIRMENEAMAIEAGVVWIPESTNTEMRWFAYPPLWVVDFEDECAQFPMGDHDDQIDPMSMYLKRVRIRRQKGPMLAPPINHDQESQWGALNSDYNDDDSNDGYGQPKHSWGSC